MIEHFVAGTTARCATSLVGMNFKTSAYFYHRLRELISLELAHQEEEVFSGEIEVDESYFGGKRKEKRGEKLCTKIIPDASSSSLMPIIERKVTADIA